MRLSFRTKLLSIVGIAAFSLVLLVVASALIARRVDRQLVDIRERYLPRAELGPLLDRTFDEMRRAFQDAVAAHETDALGVATKKRDDFVRALAGAGDAVDAEQAGALHQAVDEYYGAAADVSRRLIADETGEALVGAIAGMQQKQTRVEEAMRHATAFDKRQLTGAFTAVAEAERQAFAYRMAISVACLVAVLVLSSLLGRAVLRSLADLTAGFARFGKGDFAQPIVVRSKDELGDVARQANGMAASLDRIDSERKKAEAALVVSNKELEAFSYAVAHDLRAPLRGINGFAQALQEDYAEKLDDDGKESLSRIAAAAGRMGQLIDALLALSRVTRTEIQHESVNLSQAADAVVKQLRSLQPEREVTFVNREGVVGVGDARLVRAVLDNLIGNAWKFTRKSEGARIEFGAEANGGGAPTYYVRDNGAGFDMAYAAKLFAPFQRLHAARDFEGTGVGLATVQRIVQRHGGRIWAESEVGKGATFRFTLKSPEGETHA